VRRERLLEDSYLSQVRQVSSKAAKAIQYGILKNEVDSSRELYNTMLQRAAEAKVASALRASTARIVDPAKIPRSPYSPNRRLSLLSGATVGLLLALVFIVSRDRFDHPLVSSEELFSISGAPELGALSQGQAPSSDAYRAILTSILFSPQARGVPQVIAISSLGSQEGKSELVFRLAASHSHMKRTVLMIDGSRNGGLQKLFGQTLEFGLRDLVELPNGGRNMLAYMTNPTWLAGVQLASLGNNASVLDLVFPQGVEHLMVEMRRNYDVVFIDTPGLSELPDARVFAKLADGVVLLVKAGKHSAADVQGMIQRLQMDQTVLLGTILNRS
jgi:Mrp family chromosome partitioning ATPase